MEQFLLSLPNSLLGWVATGFLVLGGLILFFNKTRREDSEVLRTSNDDLRKRMDDQDKTMDSLKVEVAKLTRRVEELMTENKSFEDLIVLALDHYFQSNPAIAIEMKGRLKK